MRKVFSLVFRFFLHAFVILTCRLVRVVTWLDRVPTQESMGPSPTTEEPQDVQVEVGDVAINPSWQWVKVQNPNGVCNGNSFTEFGEVSGIREGAKLTAVAVTDHEALVHYQSPNRQGYGSEAGNGTLFYLTKAEFVGMTPAYELKEQDRATAKARVVALLQESLQSCLAT